MMFGSTRTRRPLLLAVVTCALALPAFADSGADKLKQARNAFDFGDYAAALRELAPTSDIDGMPREDDRVEAWKLVGLSHFFLGKPTPQLAQQAARSAFFELLKQNPDYQLDPIFVPPDAVAFFDSVRRDEEVALAPIRKFRNARKEQEILEAEARRLASMHSTPVSTSTTIVERKVALNSPLIALMPFGLGQFQNGNNSLGAGLAAGQAVGIITSLVSFLMIEVLRDPTSGRFKGDNFQLARGFDIAKYSGAGVFYGLWVAGAIEAAVHFVPERTLNEQQPSAAPTGPLKPPAPTELTPTPAPVRRAPVLVPPPSMTPEMPILKPETPHPVTPRTDESADPTTPATTTTSTP